MSNPTRLARASTAFLVAGFVAAVSTPLSAKDQSAGSTLPGRINAQYAISLGAFDLGHFSFEQKRSGGAYSAKSIVELSALLGAFQWRGVTTTSGALRNGTPSPKSYAFDFRSKNNGGLVRMEFSDGNVVGVSAVPASPRGGNMVALKPAHTRQVLDPLTAILNLAQGQGGNPCGRTLPIFDGKQRFNLTFNFRRYEAVQAGRRGKIRGVVCQIKYKPLSGYVANKDTRRYSAENNIEVAFRPVAGGRVFVPYRLTLPTVIGTARLDLKKLSVSPVHARVAAAGRRH